MQASVRAFAPKQKLLIQCLLALFIVIGVKSRGQTTIVSDGLNGSSSLFTVSGGNFYSTNSASGDRPASTPFFIEGTSAYGVTNTTGTLTSSSNISTTGYTGIQLSLRLAAFSISSTANGLDGADYIKIGISTNGGTSYTDYLTVNGNSNAYWNYSATGIATTPSGTSATFAPGGGGIRTTDGYSTLNITSLPATATLRVRITLFNNDANERWVVDDFKITGTVTSTSTPYYWNGGNALTLNGTWDNNDAKWATTPTGTVLIPWPNAGSATAYFNNTNGGTVTLPATITVTPDATNIGSNGYTFITGTADASFVSPISLGSNTLNFAPATGNINATGNITGTGSITLNSASSGNLNLSGTNTFTGGITASATAAGTGRIRFDNINSLPTTGTIAINTGGSVRLNANGNFGATGQVLQLSPNQTSNPAFDVTFGSTGNTGKWLGTVALNADSRVDANTGNTLELGGVISGAGKIIKQGNGTLALSASSNNTYTGGTQIGNGTITVASTTSLGSSTTPGSLTFAATTNGNTAINLNNSTQTIGSLSTDWTAANGTVSQTLTLNGTALTVNQSANTTFGDGGATFTAFIVNGISTGSIIKTGSGALTLTGTNTYTGGTTVTAGSIILGKGDILDNTGKIVMNGGTFSTGTAAGYNETVGALSLSANSIIALGTGSHALKFTSAGTFTAGTTLTINNWTGSIGSSGTAGQVFVGTTTGTALTPQQLSQINFTGFGVGAQQLSSFEVVPATQPVINVAPTSLSGFSYVEGSGPSAAQTFTASGSNLIPYASGSLTITAPTDYEVSKNNTTFTSSVSLSYTNGTLAATTIYVHMKSGLVAGLYNNETITVSGGSAATSPTITLNGMVTPCLPPTTHASSITFSNIYSSSFTTSWTSGNGVGRIAVINTTNTFTNPANATSLPAVNTVYSGSGEQVVYAGTGTTVTVSGLTASTTYYIRVYEYNNCSGTYTYQTSTATGNPNSVITAALGNCSSLITDNFDYGITPSTNLPAISGGNWTCFADCTTPLFNYSPSRGLVYPGYADGAVGGAANVVGANKTDISRTLNYTPSATATSALYMSFLMNFTSATASTNTYFLTFKDNSTSAYFAKLAPQQIGTTSTYAIGVTKYNSVSSYSGVYQYGKTYLVVLKYTIVPGSTNDSTKAWIFSSGFPASEPATPTYTATDVSSQDAGTVFNSIILRQEAGIDGYIDGIRVATTWSDALCQGPATPIAYQWQPTSGTANDFNTTTNWSPVRSAPLNTDILNFTKGGTSSAINVPNQGIGQMNISGNTSIAFSSSAASNFVINDDPGVTATDLTIDAGSSLIIDSDNPLELNLVNAATASVSGNVTMKNTTGSVGRDDRLTSETANGIVFNSGSVFAAQKLTGSAFGATTPNSVSFLSGSTYIAGDGSSPFALPIPSSVVVFNSGSLYKHSVSSPPSFAGRTYGNFEYAISGTVALGLSGTNAATIDNFTVSSGTLSVPNTVTQPFAIKGNINIASGATFAYDPLSSNGSSTITLSGTAAQTISGTGTFTLGANSTLSVNNAAGVSLFRDLIIGGSLNLLSGSFAIGPQTLTFTGPAIIGTPANLSTTSASSLVFGGSSTGVFIPSSVAALNNLTVNNANGVILSSNPVIGGILTLTNGPFVIMGRTVTLNGAVTRTGGSITGSSTSDLVLNGSASKALYFTSSANVLRNLTINAGATNIALNNALDIIGGTLPGTLICDGALQTNGYLTLRSDINGTAAVGQSAGTISGNVTVERYTDASQNAGSSRRAWRLVTSPVSGPTIRQSWQENGVNTTGYGTLITGYNMPDATTAAAQGYDFTGANYNASIRHYIPASNNWQALSSDGSTTGTLIPVRKEQAYLLFVRGDRTITTGSPTIATIRASGSLLQGTQTVLLTAGTYTLAGNPYASAIDFGTLRGHNNNNTTIQDLFYIWNSKLSTYGAYVLVNSNGSGGYQATPSPLTGTGTDNNSAYRFIPSGSGFLVSPLTGVTTGSVTITEADKAAVNAPPVSPFRVVNVASNLRQLLVNLTLKESDTSVTLADGFRVLFSDDYIGNEEDNSIIKADNFDENIGLVYGKDSLIIEARKDVKKMDTLQIKLWNVKQRAYQLQLKAENFVTAPGIRAWLEDTYLKTKQELSLDGNITTTDFGVTADTASSDIDRFRVVFENASSALPVTITKITAQPKNNGSEVNWTVSNETNIKGYTVEKSVDGGRTFTGIGTQAARNNAQAAFTTYTAYDAQPEKGENFYRVRIESNEGTVSYSEVVKVSIGGNGNGMQITLYPNPVRDEKAYLLLSNLKAGSYLISVYSADGRIVYQKKSNISTVNIAQREPLLLGNLAQGNYLIKVVDVKGHVVGEESFLITK